MHRYPKILVPACRAIKSVAACLLSQAGDHATPSEAGRHIDAIRNRSLFPAGHGNPRAFCAK
jgi:hypothetical protein